MNKFIFIFIFVFVLIGSASFAASPQIGTIEVTSLSDNTAVITWVTDVPSDSKIDFGITNYQMSSSSSESTLNHLIEITGLASNRTYTYRISSTNSDGTTFASVGETFTTLTRPTGDYLFSFATISDFQYADGKPDTTGVRGRPYTKSADILSNLVSEINKRSPSFTILKGDMIEAADGGAYNAQLTGDVKTGLDKLASASDITYKYYPIPGNHEKTAFPLTWVDPMRTLCLAFPNVNPNTDNSGSYSFDYKGYHFILLDCVKNNLEGHVDTDWLKNDLSSNSTKKSLVFLHYSTGEISREAFPDTVIKEITGSDTVNWNKIDIDNYQAFKSTLEAYSSNIGGVFEGHIHDNSLTRTNGIPYVRTAAPIQFPVGYTIYKVYTNGYIQTFYKVNAELSEYARARITTQEGITQSTTYWEQEMLGPISARNFTETYSALSDTTPPVVAITSLVAGQIVTGEITVTATLTDNVAVKRAEFFANNTLLGTVESSPFTYKCNTSSFNNGQLTIRVKGFDVYSNSSEAIVVVTTQNNIPHVLVSHPNGGEILTGNTTAEITYGATYETDNLTLSLFYSTDSGTTYSSIASNIANTGSYSWTVPDIRSTTARIRIQALGINSGIVGTGESTANFTIYRSDNIPPAVSIQPIANNATTSYKPTFTGTAEDTTSTISSVECKIDSGDWISAEALDGTFNSSREVFVFKTPSQLNRGLHKLEVRASDSVGNITSGSYESYSFYVTSLGPNISATFNGNSVLNNDPISSTPSIEATIITVKDINLSSVRILVDAGTPITTGITKTKITDGKYYFTYQFTTLAEGTHTITMDMLDVDGNVGTFELSGLQVHISSVVEIQGSPLNYPNPFTPAWSGNPAGGTSLSYILSKAASLSFLFYDISGTLIYKTSVSANDIGGKAGYNEFFWNGQSNAGTPIGNGIYLYFILSDGKVIANGKLTVYKQ